MFSAKGSVRMTQLLVSVRTAPEAKEAIAGGADWIDVKEPQHGPLGRAGDPVIAEVFRTVANRRPISAALGELRDVPTIPTIGFEGPVKVGLAQCLSSASWQDELSELADRAGPSRFVPVAYADWQRAQSPPPARVLAFALEHECLAFLIDTWQKDGSTLLTWCSLRELAEYRRACRRAETMLAVAGSLRCAEIVEVLAIQPDIIAVRGAACKDGKRTASVHRDAVRRLADRVAQA